MKKLDLNKEFRMLPNTTSIGKMMYEVLADNLAMSTSNNISPRKAWEWANTLYDKKELEIVSEDVELLKKYIETDLKTLPNFITAQLLYCLE